jgi:hypothetical protein
VMKRNEAPLRGTGGGQIIGRRHVCHEHLGGVMATIDGFDVSHSSVGRICRSTA